MKKIARHAQLGLRLLMEEAVQLSLIVQLSMLQIHPIAIFVILDTTGSQEFLNAQFAQSLIR